MLSGSSFLERAIYESWIFTWFLWRMWSNDQFESFRWQHMKKFELKSMIALFISIGLSVQLMFDISEAAMVYDEGFYVLPQALPLFPSNVTSAKDSIINTPPQLWSDNNRAVRRAMQYILCFSFALLAGTLFLVQAFWSHLATQWGKKRFITSIEFKLYVIFSIANFIIYPIILIAVEHDYVLSESAPQFAFACTLLVVLILSLRNNRKLQSLYPAVQHGPRAIETLMRLEYFVEMNRYLSFGVSVLTISFMILCIDAFAGPKLILERAWADFLITSFNLGGLILWVVMILIIFPPRFYLIGMRSRMSTSVDPHDPTFSRKTSTTPCLEVCTPSSDNQPTLINVNINAANSSGISTPEPKSPTKVRNSDILEEKIVQSVHTMLEQQERCMQQFRKDMRNAVDSIVLQSPSQQRPSSQLPETTTARMSTSSTNFSPQSSVTSLQRSVKTLSTSYVYI